jgi:hypothetical protein
VILEAVFQRLLDQLEALASQREADWRFDSIDEFVGLQFALHVDFCEVEPACVQLWFGGRVSPSRLYERGRALARWDSA